MNKKKYDDAIEKFMKVREDFPFDPMASIAQVKLADAYFEKKEYLLAAGVYEDFFNAHPEDENVPYALRRLAESYTRLSPSIDRDQANTVKAIERFTYLKNRYPQSRYAKDVQTQIDELTQKQAAHEMYVAEFYHKTERYNASILRLDYYLTKYPAAKNRDKALFLMADCYTRLQEIEKSNRYRDQLKKEFPGSIYATSTVRKPTPVSAVKPLKADAAPEGGKKPLLALDTDVPPRREIDLKPPVSPQASLASVSLARANEPGRTEKEEGPPGGASSSTLQDAKTGVSAVSAARGMESKVSDTGAANKDNGKKGPLGFFSAEKKPIDVISDSMEGLEKGKVIIFKGNVIARQGDLEMFSDTLTAYLGEETNEIEKALARGHVKIVKQDRIATCEDALFENTKGEITLKGNVIVYSGPNKVSGDTVRYFINEDRVSVESEKGKKAHVTVHPKQQ